MWRRAIVALVLVVAACGGDDGASTASAPETTGDAPEIAEVGQPVPDDVTWFTFDGGNASMADYAGRPLVVNFWASWCPPCITEMPAFEEVHQALGDRVAFLGIDVQESAADGQAFLEDIDVTWDLGRDPDGDMVSRLGGVGMPTTVLIDADGIVQYIHTGELSGDELSDLIDEKLLQ
jgi:cytochrome c biogenesis protein CcmG, thiol:disulfide interchange protein DsbE